jgi:endonuclease/exonuclease/phosphatase family metal-dependent hydrolase
MSKTFRIATYNIHKCKGLDLRVKPLRIVEVLRQIKADVIALQEVVSIDNGPAEKNQARYIADELGLEMTMGENRRHRGGGYGNVLLSRFPIVESRNLDITVRGREPRGCLHAGVRLTPDSVVDIYNLHLGTAFMERRHQARRLLDTEILNRRHTAPRIMLGDFNEWTHGLASRLLKHHFPSSDIRSHLGRKHTYPGFLPIMHLDHIYYDHHLVLENATVHRSRKAMVASDHLPLIADFRFECPEHTVL